MSIVTLTELPAMLGRNRRLLGLDPGTRTIGIALSDVGRSIATPMETIRRTKFRQDATHLFDIVDAQEVDALVMGLPVSMDGSEGPRCQSVRQLAANLLAIRDMPILLWDERLSSAAVERMMIQDADLSRKRRGELVDKLAAAYILQGALDALARL